MARHSRYYRSLRLSRRTARAAFDTSFSFYSPEAAQEAARIIWDELAVKARVDGNYVIYEDPMDDELSDAVRTLLDDLLLVEEEEWDNDEAELFDEQQALYDEIDPEAYNELSPDDVDQGIDDAQKHSDVRRGTKVIWIDAQSGRTMRGVVMDVMMGYARIAIENDFVQDAFGRKSQVAEVPLQYLGTRPDTEPPIEQVPEGYQPTKRSGNWMTSPFWADLAIDYSQLPDEEALEARGKQPRISNRDTDELLDLASQYEGSDDPADQADFLAIIFELQRRKVDEWDNWYEYIQLYRFAQEGKGDVGTSRNWRASRRVRQLRRMRKN